MRGPTPISCCLLLALAGSLCAAEHPRYGAEGFKPTPQQPIGFQADGNGWYPGATPQVVEWWDGKPGWGKVVSRGGEGNQSPPFDDSSYKEVELRVFTDKVPKNILWKIPTPGHSDAQPVVVGDRIICTFYPHFTVCYDLKTGKELWRDAMEMAFLPELLVKAYPNSWEIYPTFARHLKPEALLAWIEPHALESSHPVNRPRIFNAWKAIGKAALPSMERVKAAMEARTPEQDRLAAEYAKTIGVLIEEMK